MKNGADRELSFVFMKNYAFDLNLKFQARHYQIIFIQLDVIGTSEMYPCFFWFSVILEILLKDRNNKFLESGETMFFSLLGSIFG